MKSGERWSVSEVAKLEWMISEQIDRKAIAAQLGRTEFAIRAKLSALQQQQNEQLGQTKRQHRRYNGASFFLS
jgi:hypothetical protein